MPLLAPLFSWLGDIFDRQQHPFQIGALVMQAPGVQTQFALSNVREIRLDGMAPDIMAFV